LRLIAIAVVGLILIASAVAIVLYEGVHPVNPTHETSVVHSNVSGLGLELTAALTPTRLAAGQNLTVVAEVNNTLSRELVVNSTSMTNPADGPCQQGFATGVHVYSGNYSYDQLFNNRSNPTPLLLYNPSLIYTCPAVFTFTYTFQSNSAVATVQASLGGSQALHNESQAVEETSNIGGYWTGTGQNYAFNRFQPGTYTVVVYDAWWNQLIEYFQV
jgi:hypothetical protein